MKTYKPEDVTITFGKGTALKSIISITVPEVKPEIPKRKFNLNTDYKIAGRSFAEYVTRRMLKDGIGFQAKTSYKEACTDLFSYIAAPVPQNDGDFLTYCHELGHCKSHQYFSSSSFYNATWSGKWTKERLVSEVNAWKWGIRYFKRLGYTLKEETIKIIQWSLDGYFANAEDLSIASKLSNEFKAYSGIDTKVPTPTLNIPKDHALFGDYSRHTAAELSLKAEARIEELEDVPNGLLNEAHTASKPLHKHSEWSIKAQKLLENKQ
jgi:hypothetical protein